MSELIRARARRSDAQRSRSAVLAAAVDVLAVRPEATLEEIAREAGVTRQTLYAHFGSRRELLVAVVDDFTARYLAALDDATLDQGPAGEALVRFVRAGRGRVQLPPAVLAAAAASVEPESEERHAPVFERVSALARRGQATGEFDTGQSPEWLAAATIALAHAAHAEVAAGRLAERDLEATLLRSLRQLFGVA